MDTRKLSAAPGTVLVDVSNKLTIRSREVVSLPEAKKKKTSGTLGPLIGGGVILGSIAKESPWWKGVICIVPFVLLAAFPMFVAALLVNGVVITHLAVPTIAFGAFLFRMRIAFDDFCERKGFHRLTLETQALIDYEYLLRQFAAGSAELRVAECWTGCGDDEKDDLGPDGKLRPGGKTKAQKIAEQKLLGYYGIWFWHQGRYHSSFVREVLPHCILGRPWKVPLAPTRRDVMDDQRYW